VTIHAHESSQRVMCCAASVVRVPPAAREPGRWEHPLAKPRVRGSSTRGALASRYHTTPLPDIQQPRGSQRRPAALRETVDRREAGRRLAEAMHTRGLNAAQLAADLGVSRSAVLKWRQGVQTPRPDYAERLADRLGIPPNHLLPLRQPVNAREGITL
jgi:ribosome-binding protein aMBF1 (putative translation factor)